MCKIIKALEMGSPKRWASEKAMSSIHILCIGPTISLLGCVDVTTVWKRILLLYPMMVLI